MGHRALIITPPGWLLANQVVDRLDSQVSDISCHGMTYSRKEPLLEACEVVHNGFIKPFQQGVQLRYTSGDRYVGCPNPHTVTWSYYPLQERIG